MRSNRKKPVKNHSINAHIFLNAHHQTIVSYHEDQCRHIYTNLQKERHSRIKNPFSQPKTAEISLLWLGV